MAQEKLLTVHTGGVHGYGGSPGGGSFSRKGAGVASPGSPDLEPAAAPEQRRDRERGVCIRGFPPRGVNIGEGGIEGTHEAVRRVPGATQGGAAPPALLASWWWPRFSLLVISEASVALIFYIFFSEFLEHF